MNKEKLTKERKEYLKHKKKKQYLIGITQITILVGFLVIWEWAANQNIIDSFITSKPSRIFETFMNLSSNNLLEHVWVTTYETMIGFGLGTILGIMIAIILWWSDFLSKVSEPYLVVLNSLPKVALRTNYYYMGRSWNTSNYYNGNFNFFDCNNIRKFKWIYKNR